MIDSTEVHSRNQCLLGVGAPGKGCTDGAGLPSLPGPLYPSPSQDPCTARAELGSQDTQVRVLRSSTLNIHERVETVDEPSWVIFFFFFAFLY